MMLLQEEIPNRLLLLSRLIAEGFQLLLESFAVLTTPGRQLGELQTMVRNPMASLQKLLQLHR